MKIFPRRSDSRKYKLISLVVDHYKLGLGDIQIGHEITPKSRVCLLKCTFVKIYFLVNTGMIAILHLF